MPARIGVMQAINRHGVEGVYLTQDDALGKAEAEAGRMKS
jgi:hypothetical protein